VKGARPTWATIRLAAIRHNFGEARRRAGGREVIAVVKADAYGHGAVPVSRALVEAGCRVLATVTVAEAAALRDAGIAAPILVLGGVHDDEEAAAAVAQRLTPVVHHLAHVELLSQAARARETAVPVHVEVDSGMRRMGVAPEQAVELLAAVGGAPGLSLAGTFTHLARGDEADLGPSREQLNGFRSVLQAARSRGIDPGLVHAAPSGAILAGEALAQELPEAGAVRPGLMLYGALPAPHLEAGLQPAMTLRSQVVHVRHVRSGEAVGYSAWFRADRPTRVATLAVGYADGVPVALSNRGEVLIHGRRHPIVGRVSMDYVGVDVGEQRVEIGDEAILFGEGQGARLPVEEAASAAGTIPYELLVRVGARVPREVVE
jgi:alanine racemase